MATKHLLNFRELVVGAGNGLRYVNRFSSSRRVHNENVAEHSFFTAFYSLIISQYLNSIRSKSEDPIIDSGLLVQKALVHDIEEQFTGDVLRPVKYTTSRVKSDIDKMGKDLVWDFFSDISQDNHVRGYMFDLWNEAKDGTLEGKILKFADFVSVLSYLYQEIFGGNSLIMKNVNGLNSYIKIFKDKEFDFIREFVDEAEDMIAYLNKVKEEGL